MAATRRAPRTPAEAERGGRMTVDELARAGGTTTRNVRAYQERGLLAPPEKVGRTGYYDEQHLERLRLITRLLDRGFTLAAIGELLAAWEQGDTLGGVLGFEQALARPYATDAPTAVTMDWLGDHLASGEPTDPDLVDRALAVGLLERDGEGLVAPSMRLLDLATDLVAAGIPIEAIVAEAEQLTTELDAVATRFHRLFEAHVWEPFAAGEQQPGDLERITEALDRARPVPAQVVGILMAQAMERQLPQVARRMLDAAAHPDGDRDSQPRSDLRSA